ncbi:uncharacterized protein PFLUO_LOCUS7513 [Penicillium psychrofluorescens]|uniref:uncharacterized protein n=1 Tax=Penicillium psychrofluorescens TaxID=3158075 RepID=UPI003CCD5BDE
MAGISLSAHHLAMNRALLRGAVCHSCRNEALRVFLSISGVPMPRFAVVPPIPGARAFSAKSPLRSDPPASHRPDIQLPAREESRTQPNEAASRHVPWYLQEESPATESRPVSAEHLPQIPDNAPEMLPVLLEYTYKDLGLDDLKLFDLRDLDAPAALGANVIMVLGTARSVKHLNVSADRLCRWLRSQYKLSPYADGLLGRNELKIKLRRKAKRARAASQAGAMLDEKDDGITTGWICVNAGIVDEGSSTSRLADAEFEGFGDVETGTSVVVQVFTEEKRADIDLDGLWQGTLDRAERKRLREPTGSPSAAGAVSISTVQKRSFHTERRLAMTDANLLNRLSEFHPPSSDPPTTQPVSSEMTPASLLKMLSELPEASVQNELGSGPDDRESTLFLRLFYAGHSSAYDLAAARLRLLSIATSRRHPAYSKEALLHEFSDFLHQGYDVSDELGFEVVSALLTRPYVEGSASEMEYTPEADVELALCVLDRLSLRGVPILTMGVFEMLYRAIGIPGKSDATIPEPELNLEDPEGNAQMMAGYARSQSQRDALARVSKLVSAIDLPFEPEQARRLMVTMFQHGDFDGFWRLWRQIPLKGSGRTQDDYLQLFQLHVELGDERRARDCLSMWVPQMAHESPAIELEGPIVSTIMHCVLVAEPGVNDRPADAVPSVFSHVYNSCTAALAN